MLYFKDDIYHLYFSLTTPNGFLLRNLVWLSSGWQKKRVKLIMMDPKTRKQLPAWVNISFDENFVSAWSGLKMAITDIKVPLFMIMTCSQLLGLSFVNFFPT